MSIDYDHSKGSHPLSVPRAALPVIFGNTLPKSLLDIGCGIGTWLKAAQELGVTDVMGVDGVPILPGQLLISPSNFLQHDLTSPLNLSRRFDAVLCLEVAEHLPESKSSTLINSLVGHADTIIFSAGAPGQDGQNHINCQWPVYWQKKFNEFGYYCTDEVRWHMWDDVRIDPWYRQNIFIARKGGDKAGSEPRIASTIHPECFQTIIAGNFAEYKRKIAEGNQPFTWYIESLLKAVQIRFKGANRNK